MVRQRFTINPLEKVEVGQGDHAILSYVKLFLKRLAKRKTITQLQAEAQGDNELKRNLGTFQLLALGVGCIIGKFNKEDECFLIRLG